MENVSLYIKINSLPDRLKVEASDFIDFLLMKSKKITKSKKRKAGFLKGTFEMNADFDEPLEDFKEYMK
ncbi:MAG: DUF2281 domain-containing protein [Bacteroidales bacterium]|nr:DUF2281 domain-containing protein [Bacteroidales bacterium]